jgi:hypothetical protein
MAELPTARSRFHRHHPPEVLAYAERVRRDVESELRHRMSGDRLEACRADGAALSLEAAVALVD